MSISVTKSNGKVFLLLGILCALIAAGLIWFTVSQGSQSSLGPEVTVVEASTTISPNAPVQAQQVKVVKEPSSAVPANALSSPSEIVGKSLITTAYPQQILTSSLILSATTISATGGSTGTCTNVVDFLQKGMVAMAIPTSETPEGNLTGTSADLFNAGLYIRAGDHIDILVDDGTGSVRYVFQDVPVLCVGTAAETPTTASILMVEVSRSQAELLTWIFTHTSNGSTTAPIPVAVKYVLRPASQYGSIGNPEYLSSGSPNLPTVADPPVTLQTIQQLFTSGQ